MDKVTLWLEGGDGIKRRAGEVLVPKFNEPPRVIIWGTRVFVRYDHRDGEYFEAFAYSVA